MVVLARTSTASLTDDSASKVAKIVVKHKIVSVRAEGYVSQPSSTPEKLKGKFYKYISVLVLVYENNTKYISVLVLVY